jgi:hypothetical protein
METAVKTRAIACAFYRITILNGRKYPERCASSLRETKETNQMVSAFDRSVAPALA